MKNLSNALHDYYGLLIAFIIIFVIILLSFLIMHRKNTKTSKLLYGLFMDYNNWQILALTFIIMNFIFLVFCLFSKSNITIPIIVISMLFIIISYILNFNFKYLIINIIINIVNLGILYFAFLVETLKLEVNTQAAIFLQILIMVFGFLFYLFATFKFIFNIRERKKINEED